MALPHPDPNWTNAILERLPPAERKKALARCELVDFALGDVLAQEGNAIEGALFPIDCVISQLSPGSDPAVEVALIGHEGMYGTGIVFDTVSMIRCTIQHHGRAVRMPPAELRRLFGRSTVMRRLLGAAIAFQGTQMARTAYCNRFHQIGERLAKWLLMMADRARSARFDATHKFLAIMLGTRRPGVTVAAAELSALKLIRYRRGEVEIIDRKGLEKKACSCYAYANQAHAKLFH